jgi:hypothetical protein
MASTPVITVMISCISISAPWMGGWVGGGITHGLCVWVGCRIGGSSYREVLVGRENLVGLK